ncbi:MAG: RsmD family RNA methyltransferase [Methylacidiphilales bacterium]|nr:RsmD family RNA methyltransferase [Candidatus Methylacidiphilales bacterium]
MPLRVISGTAGGLHLQSPKRHALRPTQDRIRQVIFSSLADVVPGAHVLDLYAGTGSFGIEALSRGAASATFIEKEPEAVECIRANLAHCHLQGEAVKSDVSAYLDRPPDAPRFDLIFADPPYIKSRGPLNNEHLLRKLTPFLVSGGVFIWEHFAGGTVQNDDTSWKILRNRTYGETGLTFLTFSREK